MTSLGRVYEFLLKIYGDANGREPVL